MELKELFENISSKLDIGSKAENQELNLELVKELIPKLKQLLEEKSPESKEIIKQLEKAGLNNVAFDMIKRAVAS